MAKLVIDTSAAVAIERGAVHVLPILDNSRVIMPQVVAAELLTAVGLADSEEAQLKARSRIAEQLADFELADFGEHEAEVLAQLRAYCIRNGRRRGENDLMIAAHAVVERAVLLTADKRARFDDLPGVVVQHI